MLYGKQRNVVYTSSIVVNRKFLNYGFKNINQISRSMVMYFYTEKVLIIRIVRNRQYPTEGYFLDLEGKKHAYRLIQYKEFFTKDVMHN